MSQFITFEKMVAVSASDTVDESKTIQDQMKGIYAGVAGNIVLVFQDGTTATVAVPAGALLPVKVKRINSTSTTATGLFYLLDI